MALRNSFVQSTYFNTCSNLTPNNAPGLVVGTRHDCSSSLTNFTTMFSVIASESFNDLAVVVSCNHLRLNC